MSKPPAKGRRGRVYAASKLSGHPLGITPGEVVESESSKPDYERQADTKAAVNHTRQSLEIWLSDAGLHIGRAGFSE